MLSSSTVKTPDGISWYCEQGGHGHDVVLIPSGEGDCFSFRQTATLLSAQYRVTTFDMPGMSRSTAPRSLYRDVTAQLLASQMITLMDHLGIQKATFYGCSSGGATVLALVANYPDRVQSGIVHEVPLSSSSTPELRKLVELSDAEIPTACQAIFADLLVGGDDGSFLAMDPEYHGRLHNNYITWVRNYIPTFGPAMSSITDEDLKRRPITWTVGAALPMGFFFDNVKLAARLGIDIGLLSAKHFPQITIADGLATHIATAAARYLEKDPIPE